MELKQILRDAGVVGAGGAGFPSYAKLAPGADTLVINGAECEPLSETDLCLLREYADCVVRGAEAILDASGISRAVLGIKRHTGEKLGYDDGQALSARVTVHLLPNAYPMGDEIALIFETTGRLVQPGELPITAGVIVYNVETLYNVDRAIRGIPVTEKWLTVGGDVPVPTVVRVPVGMRVSDLFRTLGISVPKDDVLVDGGPSMGKIVPLGGAVVRKTTKQLLLLPRDIPATVNQLRSSDEQRKIASSACCQCTRCTDLCPRNLLGYPLEPHRMVRSSVSVAEADPILIRSAQICCSCGICAIAACCQGISPRAVINDYKAVLARNRVRYNREGKTFAPHSERPWRMISSDRWEDLLGVTRFDRPATFLGELIPAKSVQIPLSMHIGAPAVPAVKVGDTVRVGDVIATAAEGALSVCIHASVAGTVRSVTDGSIVLEA